MEAYHTLKDAKHSLEQEDWSQVIENHCQEQTNNAEVKMDNNGIWIIFNVPNDPYEHSSPLEGCYLKKENALAEAQRLNRAEEASDCPICTFQVTFYPTLDR